MTESLDPGRLLAEVLTAHGPLHEDDVAEHLRDTGVADPARILRHLRLGIDFPAVQLTDERWVWLPTVLAGRVFTRRVTEPEADFDVLTVTPDLDPIAALCDYPPYQRLADGSAVHRVSPGDDQLLSELDIPSWVLDAGGVLALAVGTFEALGVGDGDLVGLRLGTAGLVVERVGAAAHTTAGARLAALLGEQPEFVDALVWTACLAAPTLFTEAAVPLSELAAERGLTRHGGWLAPPGFNFARWEFVRECERLAARHHLGIDDTITVSTLLVLYRRMAVLHLQESAPAGDGSEPRGVEFDEIIEGLGPALADPAIAEVLAAETVRHGRFGAGGLRLLAEALERKVPPSARMAYRWLGAVARERDGDIAGFESALLAAEAMDGDWPPTLLDLARIASDRGDAEDGLALLQRAGAAADHPLVYLLRRHRSEKRNDLGRNAPCWCGSGRKYKKCHLGHTELSLRDRVGWLYHKAVQHVLFGDWTDLRYAVAFERCRCVIADDEDAFNAALADPVVIDTVLFEGGGFEEFLAVRGALLPEDEQALAEAWLLVERSVFEIEHTHRGGGVTVRDVRTGERHEVDECTAGHPLHPGQLVCARVAPDGVGLRFFGLAPVSVQDRDRLIALLNTCPDPVQLMAQLSSSTSDADSPPAASGFGWSRLRRG